MKVTSFFILTLASLLLFNVMSFSKNTKKISFNNDWQFVRITNLSDTKNTKERSKTQDGDDWTSQFNIEHVEATGKNSEESKQWKLELEKELNSIKKLSWENISIPHTAFIEPYTIVNPWQGISYYRKNFTISKKDKDKKIFVEFEGAMQLADVWVNGKHMLQHAGGFTPFSVDISNIAKFGSSNEVLVRLDNADNKLIPPGKPIGNLDFCYHSGIYRDVNLVIKNKTYITNAVKANKVAGGGIFITYPEVSESKATIQVQVHVKNEAPQTSDCQLEFKLIDAKGKQQAIKNSEVFKIENGKDLHITTSFEVSNPELWSPDKPSLYTLKTVLKVNSKTTDVENINIGIRSFEISRDKGFVLNGKPIRLVGTNRHMEYPYVGNAISDNAQYRDLYKIKQAGYNTVRLGHYPQDVSVLEACDEIGLFVIEPMPGWQFFNKDSIFVERTYRDIRDMIRRDRNHASIIMWETILNESWPPAWWKDMAYKTAHEEFPGKQCYAAGDMYGYYGWDVLYNDWKEDITRPSHDKKPGFIREYGDYEFGGNSSTTRTARIDGEKKLLNNAWNFQWSHNRYRQQYPATIGDANWDMYDYNRGCCVDVCKSGVSELNRLPKFSYYFYRSQMDIGTPLPNGKMDAMVYIANWWTERQSSDVVVYGNVDEIELFVNGKSIARQTPDNGPDTEYTSNNTDRYKGGNPFDGGNAKNLKHPPFTFKNVKWEKGELKAVGYYKGEKVVEQKTMTPEEHQTIKIRADKSGKEIDKNDVFFVYAELLDTNGALCVDAEAEIELQLNGDAEIVSPKTMKAEAGIAAFLIKTGNKKCRISFKAKDVKHDEIKGKLVVR